jgi:hypothetical protein
MKNLKLIFSVLVMMAFSSCSKDDNPEANDPNEIKFRVKEIYVAASNSLVSKFTYNNENLVTKTTQNVTFIEYVYTNGYLNQEALLDSNTLGVLETINYSLDDNAVIEKKTKVFATNKIYSEVYVNNASKRPLSMRFFDYNPATQAWISDPTKDEDYQYDAQNRIIEKDTYEFHFEYTYDNKSNLIEQKKYNVSGEPRTYLLVEKIETTFNDIKPKYYLNSSLSKNSPLTVKTSIYDDGAFQSASTDIYRYDFNSSNYILKSYKNNIPEFDFTLENF